MSSPENFKKIIKKISSIARSNGIRNSYVVGGYPRSLVMDNVKNDTDDLDFASAWPGEATKLGSIASSEMIKDLPKIYHRTGTIEFEYNGVKLEFQGTLGGISDNQMIVSEMEKFGISITPLTVNLYSRDFTINTLILDLNDESIYDITGFAIKDIKNKIIRTPVNPDVSCQSNPLIMLRAIRFSLRYGFKIDTRLKSSIRKYKDTIRSSLSSERLQLEVLKMLQTDYDGTISFMEDFNMGEILSNEDYDIFKILSNIDIENFDGDLDNLIKEKSI